MSECFHVLVTGLFHLSNIISPPMTSSTLLSHLLSDDSTFIENEVIRAVEGAGVVDIKTFQLAVSVSDELQDLYSKSQNNIESQADTDSTPQNDMGHHFLKELCRERFKSVVSKVLSHHSSKCAGSSAVEFNPDSELKVTVNLGLSRDVGRNFRKRRRYNNDAQQKGENHYIILLF